VSTNLFPSPFRSSVDRSYWASHLMVSRFVYSLSATTMITRPPENSCSVNHHRRTAHTVQTGALMTSVNQWWIKSASPMKRCKERLRQRVPAYESRNLDYIRKTARKVGLLRCTFFTQNQRPYRPCEELICYSLSRTPYVNAQVEFINTS